MPYIKNYLDRNFLDTLLKEFVRWFTEKTTGKIDLTGNLNYFLFKLCKLYIAANGESYENYRNFIGELEAAKSEIYRRLIAPYEDKKIEENRDVE